MRLQYVSKDGIQKIVELSDKPLTIGRSADADVLILDDKASRVHCGIRFWDGDFYIKDLKSKNGIFVNEKKVDIQVLVPGDKIRVGASVFVFEQTPSVAGASTAVKEMADEFAVGKGYSTILREIVTAAEDQPMRSMPGQPTDVKPPPEPGRAPQASETTGKKTTRKKIGKLGSKKKFDETSKSAGKKKVLKVRVKKKPE
jgi:pSer/pThr/pTyr-binding forkhead associated (FHA) protein